MRAQGGGQAPVAFPGDPQGEVAALLAGEAKAASDGEAVADGRNFWTGDLRNVGSSPLVGRSAEKKTHDFA